VKFREEFRPFAPAVLEEKASDYFDIDRPAPFMLLVPQVREGKGHQIPAVTHVDNSARVQTVSASTNPRFHRLISAFEKLSGVPVVINTSFNVRGEPIVCTPEDAYNCFLHTDIDFLVMNDFLVEKKF
jgi:carbamoyltransferase